MVGANTGSQGLGRAAGNASLPGDQESGGLREVPTGSVTSLRSSWDGLGAKLETRKDENPTIPGSWVNKSLPHTQNLPNTGRFQP